MSNIGHIPENTLKLEIIEKKISIPKFDHIAVRSEFGRVVLRLGDKQVILSTIVIIYKSVI